MMRVITGSARGRRLETLPGEDVTRPTTESVKEALFSMIQFVENNRGAKQVVERNLAHCRLEEQANVVFSDALSFLNRSGTYDLVLLDPPYGKGVLQRVLPALVPRLSDDAMVVCESGRDEELPAQVGSFVLDRERRHGKTKIALYLRGKDLAE